MRAVIDMMNEKSMKIDDTDTCYYSRRLYNIAGEKSGDIPLLTLGDSTVLPDN